MLYQILAFKKFRIALSHTILISTKTTAKLVGRLPRLWP